MYIISDNPRKNPTVIVMADLKVANMFKPATGNLENPGKNVKVKSKNIRNMQDISDYSLLNVSILNPL